MSWQKYIVSCLEEKRLSNAFRSRVVVESSTGRFLVCNGRQYYNFSGNDYLGLSRHPAVIRAWQRDAERYGVGSGSSGHINGYTTAHFQFEEELADWLGYSRALLFISGFSANQAVITALMKKNDRVIADRLSHASLLRAAHFSLAQLRRFRHNNLQNLKFLLDKPHDGHLLVITEGIFSMDGDSAPLNAIYSATKQKNGWLMVDDAHGFSVIGTEGRGSCSKQQIKPDLLVVTFSKGAGVSGAAVLCNENVADYLLQYAHHLIYSTSMPPAQAGALLASLNVIRSQEGEEKRHKLAQNIRQFRDGISSFCTCISESDSPIQPLIVGDNTQALMLMEHLRKRDIWTIAIRPPTVPQNMARLRLTLSATHENTDILALLEALYDKGKSASNSCSI